MRFLQLVVRRTRFTRKEKEMINQYQDSEKHPGNQPTRVLVNNVIASFENVYPAFREEAKTHYEKYGLKPGIPYTIANKPLFLENKELTPYSDRDENGEEIIALSETLLSYVWCVCYTLSTFYYEMMFVPSREKTYFKMNFENMLKALNVFGYGYSLLNTYSEWDKERLINPEVFDEEDKFLIGMANHAFTNAITYILCHELAHVKNGHNKDECKVPTYKKEEKAEKDAFQMIINGIQNDEEKLNRSIGTIAGICSLMFFSDTVMNGDHPDSDIRILWYYELLDLDPNDSLWGIPCIAYRLWDIANKKEFNYSQDEKTYKDLFLSLMEQERAK